MKKKVLSVLLAGCICCPMMAMASYGETPVHALTIIASVTNISVFKDTIAVGESVQLELEWSTGAEQMVYYSSSDESIATVDQNGLVTGIGNGTAIITLSHSNIGTDKTITINVSEDAESNKTYNTSELTLETKLKKYDTLHYTGTGAGSCLNVVNTEGGYDIVYLNSEDYVLPFDAEIVGIDGLVMYVAPDIEGITYLDGRTLSVGDTIDRNTHLLCYDYHINNKVLPVFLPDYYDKYIGDGTIKVKAIDHDEKTITLESVSEQTDLTEIINNFDALWKADYVTVSGNQALVKFHTMVQVDGCVIEADKMEWTVCGTADTNFVTKDILNSKSYDDNQALSYCLITANSPGTVCVSGTEYTQYGKRVTIYFNLSVDENGNFNSDYNTNEPLAVDEFDWLPATMDDYEAFIAENESVSVHGKYIVYCDEINYSTGDEVILEQLGTAEIKKVKEYSISSDEPLPAGSQSHVVYVYEAISAGTIKITISQGRPWDSEQTKNVKDVGYYKIDESMSIIEIDESEFTEPVKGDVNADGKFSVADVVMLQKWLICVHDVTLSNWKAADLCEDGVLNVFDLCMMKYELINKS